MNNNQRLVEIMQEHELSITQVAKLIDVSPWTVKNWRRAGLSGGFRRMPDVALRALEMSVLREPQQESKTPTSKSDLPDLVFLPADDPG